MALLLALLTLLPLLALLALLTLLALLALLTRLIAAQLLALLAFGHLFQLALQLFGFAAQHLLLPALLGSLLLAFLLLLGQFLLPPGELLQFLQRLVDLLLLLLLRAGRLRLAALVLILLGIEFEIEQAFQVARAGAAAATTAATTLLAEGDLDIAEGASARSRYCSAFCSAAERPATWRPSTCPTPGPSPRRPFPCP